jgi:hypothetical protein
MALHPLEGIDRVPEALDDRQQTRMAEVMGRERGELQEPDVGRRSPSCDLSPRLLLEVVGWKPLVLRSDERVEEEPGAPCQETKATHLVLRQCERPVGPCPADDVGDPGGEEPEHQDAKRGGERRRPADREERPRAERGQRSGRHLTPEGPA